MKKITKLKLASIHQVCESMDISTEKMFVVMSEIAKVDNDTVVNYLSLTDNEKKELFQEVNELTDVLIKSSNL